MPRGGNLKNRNLSQAGRVALRVWPKAPTNFTPGEVAAWKRLGRAAMEGGSVAASDLVLAERCAQIGARVAAAMGDETMRPSMLVSLARLETDLLSRLGLTPQARATVGVLAKPKPKSALDEF
jgi:phage terminase small subunit